MGKAGWIDKLAQRKNFLVSFWRTFLAVLGLLSALLAFLGTPPLTIAVGLFICALLFSVIINKHRIKGLHLPVEELFPEDLENAGRKRLRCHCGLLLANQVGPLAQSFFGAETISPDKYEQLRVKNPNILVCLTGAHGDFLGYFDVIPLKQHFANLFLQGAVTEKQITHEDIFAADEMTTCRHVYLSGIAAHDPFSATGKTNAAILVWGLLKYLDHFYSATEPLAFASAVTKAGDTLLQKFRMNVCCEATGRVDKHKMYMISLTHEEIAKRLACIQDMSHLCSLEWVPSNVNREPISTPGTASTQRHRRASLPKRKLRSLPLPATGATRRT